VKQSLTPANWSIFFVAGAPTMPVPRGAGMRRQRMLNGMTVVIVRRRRVTPVLIVIGRRWLLCGSEGGGGCCGAVTLLLLHALHLRTLTIDFGL